MAGGVDNPELYPPNLDHVAIGNRLVRGRRWLGVKHSQQLCRGVNQHIRIVLVDDDFCAGYPFHVRIAADMIHVAVRIHYSADPDVVFRRQADYSFRIGRWIYYQRFPGSFVSHKVGENPYMPDLPLFDKHFHSLPAANGIYKAVKAITLVE
jgi:hypothetical protein